MSLLTPRPGTPAALGYRMPAEWEPHEATWLAWPHKESTWPGKLSAIPAVWIEMVRALAAHEMVRILVDEAAPAHEVRQRLEDAGVDLRMVSFHEIATDDAWIRDHGPIFVRRAGRQGGELAVIDWGYNAWGGKYPPWDQDDRVPSETARLLGLPCFAPGLVLEGGSIDVNGQGTLLTSESCLLNPNRNPHLGREEIEQALCDYLGARNILWLGEGIAGDDTDGHVDDMARFVGPSVVVAAVEEDEKDVNYEPLRANLRRLEAMRDQDGRPLRVVHLPMPEPIFYEGARLPASYANFYIANRAVLVPVFGQQRDAEALRVLHEVFPDRRLVGIHATDLVWGLGAFHCVTQQQPAAARLGAD